MLDLINVYYDDTQQCATIMITIFTCPKPFVDQRVMSIQVNAIKSWLRLRPKPEILLMGDDEGVAEMAAECAIEHIADIAKNSYGTPLVSDMFEKAQANAIYDIMVYVNTDIIFGQEFARAVEECSEKKPFLMLGRRWDYDIHHPINFGESNWNDLLRADVYAAGKRHGPTGMDYFVFRKGTVRNMPHFAVGRGGWDNWLLGYGVRNRWKVCDASDYVMAIHQNHEYGHVPAATGVAWEGPETNQNNAFIANREHIFRITDAGYILKGCGPCAARDSEHVNRRLMRWAALCPGLFRIIRSWKVKYLLCWLFPRL